MKLKWIFCSALFLLAGCAANKPTLPALQVPSVAATQAIENQFAEANDKLSPAWNAYIPIKQADGSLLWHINAPTALSFADSSDLEIKPAIDDRLTVQVFNYPDAKLVGTTVLDVLALKFSSVQPGKVVVYVPAKTKYFMATNVESLKGAVDQHLLYLNLRDCGYVQLQSKAWMLQYLYVNNTRQVDLADVATPYLLTWAKDSGVIRVHGVMSLRELDVQNTNFIEMYWLNSPIAKVNVLDKSQVFLAGDAIYMNGQVIDHSKLSAKYLRAHRLFVQTKDAATAEVTALDSLNALAKDNSNIYYYNQPKVLSRYYENQGSVIYMGEAPAPCHAPQCLVIPRVLPG